MIEMLRPSLVAAFLLLAPSVVVAQGTLTPAPAPAASPPAADAAAAGGPLAACRADIDTLCPGAAGPDRRKCLRDNGGKLSPACQTALTDVAAKAKAMRDACPADITTHCAGIDTSDGKLGQCLRTNVAKLSPACGTAVKARFPNG